MSFEVSEVVCDSDRAVYAEVRNRVNPCNPYTADELLHAWSLPPDCMALLALSDGEPAGYAYVEVQHWAPDATTALADIGVLTDARGYGLGSALYRAVSRWCAARALDGLDLFLVLGQGDATAFWMRRGFSEVFRESVSKLDLAGADLPAAAPPIGVRLVTLAERGDLDDAVYAVACEAIADSSGADGDGYEAGDFDHWRTAEFRSPGVIEDCTIIALAAGDMVVGYASLWRMGALPGTALHGFTGVARASRGRGVARALKLEQLIRAQRIGITAVRTENVEANAPMLAINRSLGYLPLYTVLVMRGPLARR